MPNFLMYCHDPYHEDPPVFQIKTKHFDDRGITDARVRIGSMEDGQLEFVLNPAGYIRYINYFLISAKNSAIDDEFFLNSDLPDCRTMDEDELTEGYGIGLDYKEYTDMQFNRYNFTLHLTNNAFVIWLCPKFRSMAKIPSSYVKDGRVEYYSDENWNLMYIKVVDLTEEEYNYLKWYCFNIH